VVISQQAFERPYFAAPGTPADRVGALRAAFVGTMRDPLFLADAGRIGMDVSPMPGEQLQEIVGKLYGTPKSILDGAKRAIRP
jgi:tripartite-type tricarboxylate transporter receptor subunit TctC